MVETGQKPTKVCNKCGVDKSIDDYSTARRNTDGKEGYCKPCRRIKQKVCENKTGNRMRKYGRHILRKYGLTWDMHTALTLRAQGHCDSCKEPFTGVKWSIHIDHCHITGDVRGLLCAPCNKSAGQLKECPDKIFSLIKYIMETRYNPFLKSEALHLSKKTT